MYNTTGYNIRYRKTGITAWTTTTSTTNSKSLAALIKNTNYEFQVQNKCSTGNSAFSSGVIFKTLNNGNSLVSGIEESMTSVGMQLFPNPAKEKVTVNYYLENPQDAEIIIKDILGRVVLNKKLVPKHGENNILIDLSNINKGFYVLGLSINGKEESVKKLIVE